MCCDHYFYASCNCCYVSCDHFHAYVFDVMYHYVQHSAISDVENFGLSMFYPPKSIQLIKLNNYFNHSLNLPNFPADIVIILS